MAVVVVGDDEHDVSDEQLVDDEDDDEWVEVVHGDDIVVAGIFLWEEINYVVFRKIDYMNGLNDDVVEVEEGWEAL